jgi:hypothetical protein
MTGSGELCGLSFYYPAILSQLMRHFHLQTSCPPLLKTCRANCRKDAGEVPEPQGYGGAVWRVVPGIADDNH